MKKIKSERYGLILLDMKLPGMRGDELYKRIQRIAGSLARRVVFITGDALGADTIEFLDRTEAPCVTKPFDAEQLPTCHPPTGDRQHGTNRVDKPFDAEQLKKAINRILAQGT